MRVLVRLRLVFRAVQLLDRVLVGVLRLLARDMNMAVRMLVRMGMFMGMRMHRAVRVAVFVSVHVAMHVRMRMIVLDWISHDTAPDGYQVPTW